MILKKKMLLILLKLYLLINHKELLCIFMEKNIMVRIYIDFMMGSIVMQYLQKIGMIFKETRLIILIDVKNLFEKTIF